MTTDIITTQEGKKRLARLEGIAGESLHTSKDAFNNAMLALDRIREEKLWHFAVDDDGVMLGDYAKPRFKEDYLRLFCARNGISVSSAYDHLDTITSCHLIGWDDDTIRQVGVREARPLKNLVRVDGRSGEVKTPPQEVIETLPPGETDMDRIRAKADEVFVHPEVPLTPADALRAVIVDTGMAPEVNIFEAGDGDVWLTFSHNNHNWDGVLIPEENYSGMSNQAREWLNKRLKIEEYSRGD